MMQRIEGGYAGTAGGNGEWSLGEDGASLA